MLHVAKGMELCSIPFNNLQHVERQRENVKQFIMVPTSLDTARATNVKSCMAYHRDLGIDHKIVFKPS